MGVAIGKVVGGWVAAAGGRWWQVRGGVVGGGELSKHICEREVSSVAAWGI